MPRRKRPNNLNSPVVTPPYALSPPEELFADDRSTKSTITCVRKQDYFEEVGGLFYNRDLPDPKHSQKKIFSPRSHRPENAGSLLQNQFKTGL